MSVALRPSEQLGRLAASRAPDGTLWIAARALPHRFARRPRTRVLVGALDAPAQRWLVAPVEVASLPGRADLSLALAASAERAVVLIERPRSVRVASVLREGGALEASHEWSPPRNAGATPWIAAQGASLAVLWRAPARFSLHTASADTAPSSSVTYHHVARRGALALRDVCGLVAWSSTSAAALFCQRSGALSLARIEDGAVVERWVNATRCPDHCERVDVTPTPRGAIVTFSIRVVRERQLRRFWASRVGADGNSHTRTTLPILRAIAAPAGPRRDALVQVARPMVLRAIDRPVALGPIDAIPRSLTALSDGDATALVLAALPGSSLAIARVRCDP